MINEFESFCQNKGCSLEIREKRRTVLTRRKVQYQQKCITYFNNAIAAFIENKSRVVGVAKIHEKIREIMQDKSKVINKEQAAILFEDVWITVKDDVRGVLKS